MSKLGVVVGGSRGIGRAVAQLLAQRGNRVVVISRNQETAQATADILTAGEHVGLGCDVSKEQEIQRAFDIIAKTCGPVGYLVNAAGINRDALLLRSKPEDMVSVLQTNLLGSMLTCRAALRSMLSKGGAIVNIEPQFLISSAHKPEESGRTDWHKAREANVPTSGEGSVVGVKGNAGQCVYSASKAGLEGFTRSLAREVASRNIRVNLVAPGLIRTDMTAGLDEEEEVKKIPLGRFGEPEEVAQSVLFLLEAPYITGQVLLVDGGLAM